MGRKSKITRMPPEVRGYIEKLLREDRLTLEETLGAIRAKFPDADTLSKSGVHRYQQQVKELAGRMRDIDTAARVVVEELGESPDDKAGALLCQSITTLATHAALSAQTRDDVSIEEVRKLARAARDTISARQMNLKDRQAMRAENRAEMAREQQEKLATIERKGGFDPETLRKIREEIYGL